MSRSKFWMVLGCGTPMYRHTTKQSATNEAERLARINAGDEFVVMESLATVVKSDLTWEPHLEDSETADELPF